MKFPYPVKPQPVIKQAVLIGFLLLSGRALMAQSGTGPGLPQAASDSPTLQKAAWYDNFRFRFPEFIYDRVFPFRIPSFSTLPYGMNQYMYPTKPEAGFFAPFTNNFSFRWLGLFYKDRIGLEVYSGGYGASVDMRGFNNYLQAKFPNHYSSDTLNMESNSYTFTGPQYGIAYKLHWKGLVLESKFILGFETMQSNGGAWIFKEMGSNQFTEYQVTERDSTRHQSSYHFQLRMAKRFRLGAHPTWYEIGLKTEYIESSPNVLLLHISEKPYGQPETDEDLQLRTRFRSFTVGLFFTVYLKNSHIVN